MYADISRVRKYLYITSIYWGCVNKIKRSKTTVYFFIRRNIENNFSIIVFTRTGTASYRWTNQFNAYHVSRASCTPKTIENLVETKSDKIIRNYIDFSYELKRISNNRSIYVLSNSVVVQFPKNENYYIKLKTARSLKLTTAKNIRRVFLEVYRVRRRTKTFWAINTTTIYVITYCKVFFTLIGWFRNCFYSIKLLHASRGITRFID